MHMQGHSDRIVRWEPTGAEKGSGSSESVAKKLNVMKCCKGKTSSTTPCTPPSAPNLWAQLTHTVEFQALGHTYTRLIAHYLSLPPYLLLSPPPTHYSLTTYLPRRSGPPPVLSSSHPHSLPAGRLSVEVEVGSVVSNSPGDTGLLTFCCTLRKEGFFSPLTNIAPHQSWRLRVHSGAAAWPWTARRWVGEGWRLCCHGAECQAWPPGWPTGWQQTDLLFVAWNTSEEDVRWHHSGASPAPEASLCSPPSLLWTTSIQTLPKWHTSHALCPYSPHQTLSDGLVWCMIENLF